MDYLSLLKNARVLIGNSSSGIIESPRFHLAVVDIGTRQSGRECSSNVIHVQPEREAIKKAVRRTLTDKTFLRQIKKCRNIYRHGGSGDRIARILTRLPLQNSVLQKQIAY